jgi:hypothetical protein
MPDTAPCWRARFARRVTVGSHSEGTLREAGDGRIALGDRGRDLPSRLRQRCVRHHPVHEPDLQRLRGADDARGEDQLLGLRESDDARQEVGAAEARQDAQLRERETELCTFPRDANVAGQRHGDAHADGGAVDRRDHGLRVPRAPPDPRRHRSPARPR